MSIKFSNAALSGCKTGRFFMPHAPITLSLAVIPLMTGCSLLAPTPEPAPPQTHYHAPVVEAVSGTAVSIPQLAERLAGQDVVMIGEYHGHQGAHLLQSRLQAHLYQHRPEQVLSMEQFEVDRQPVLDRYLAGDIGEMELVEDAGAWPIYQYAYRPLVEFARRQGLPVIAANAPGDIVRCVGREGPEYLAGLNAARKRHIPDAPFAGSAAYREKFFGTMGGRHGTADNERLQNTYHAQLLRDNTMASRILAARERHPEHQVIHLTGTFHSEERLGTVEALLQRNPELSVAVISPVFMEAQPDGDELPLTGNQNKGDYLYFLLPLPPEYRDEARGHESMMDAFRKVPETTCD